MVGKTATKKQKVGNMQETISVPTLEDLNKMVRSASGRKSTVTPGVLDQMKRIHDLAVELDPKYPYANELQFLWRTANNLIVENEDLRRIRDEITAMYLKQSLDKAGFAGNR